MTSALSMDTSLLYTQVDSLSFITGKQKKNYTVKKSEENAFKQCLHLKSLKHLYLIAERMFLNRFSFSTYVYSLNFQIIIFEKLLIKRKSAFFSFGVIKNFELSDFFL